VFCRDSVGAPIVFITDTFSFVICGVDDRNMEADSEISNCFESVKLVIENFVSNNVCIIYINMKLVR
jgi:hypothetical protein